MQILCRFLHKKMLGGTSGLVVMVSLVDLVGIVALIGLLALAGFVVLVAIVCLPFVFLIIFHLACYGYSSV